MSETTKQTCTCDAKTMTWSNELEMYVCSGCGLPMPDWWYEDWPDDDNTCPNCYGTGGEPYDDFCTPCEHCDGMGYEWWR